jgi:hypothetical protein
VFSVGVMLIVSSGAYAKGSPGAHASDSNTAAVNFRSKSQNFCSGL